MIKIKKVDYLKLNSAKIKIKDTEGYKLKKSTKLKENYKIQKNLENLNVSDTLGSSGSNNSKSSNGSSGHSGDTRSGQTRKKPKDLLISGDGCWLLNDKREVNVRTQWRVTQNLF